MACGAYASRYEPATYILFSRSICGVRGDLDYFAQSPNCGIEGEIVMRMSFGFIFVILVAYVVGAKWPMLAQKVGIA